MIQRTQYRNNALISRKVHTMGFLTLVRDSTTGQANCLSQVQCGRALDSI